jgi:hypothetical protein
MKPLKFIALAGFLASCNLIDDQNPDQSTVSVDELFTTSPTPTSPSQTPSVNGNWRVHLLVEDGFDLTKNFENIRFTFSNAGVLEGKLGEETIAGRWRLERERTYEELYLDFPTGSILDELDEDWFLIERSENVLVLEERDDQTVDRLVLVKDATDPGIDSPFSTNQEKGDSLFQTVFDSQFRINQLSDDDRDRTSLFEGFRLKLLPFGRLEIERPNQAPLLGTWQVGFNNQHTKLELELAGEGIAEYLDDDWSLQAKENGLIQFIELDDLDRDRLELVKI